MRARRVVFELAVAVDDVVDLSSLAALTKVGLSMDQILSDDFHACQQVGGAAAWLGFGGLLVPSARAVSENLVIIVGDGPYELTVVRQDVIDEGGTAPGQP